MQIPQVIRQTPAYIQGAWNQTKHWTEEKGHAIHQAFTTELWPKTIKPFYERNIHPINQTDCLIVAASVIVAFVVALVVIKIFTVAVFPLAVGVGAVIILSACFFTRYRLRKHFDEIAWDHVEKIRQTAHHMTLVDQNFKKINRAKGHLIRPEFAHLENDVKMLDEELRKFRAAILAPPYQAELQIVTAHLGYLKVLVGGNAQDKVILENLEIEVNKAGKQGQDLKALELCKQKLTELQTPGAQIHIQEMKNQVDKLVRATNGADLEDAKAAFTAYLEAFQQKLASHKEIPVLLPIADPYAMAEPDVDEEADIKEADLVEENGEIEVEVAPVPDAPYIQAGELPD